MMNTYTVTIRGYRINIAAHSDADATFAKRIMERWSDERLYRLQREDHRYNVVGRTAEMASPVETTPPPHQTGT